MVQLLKIGKMTLLGGGGGVSPGPPPEVGPASLPAPGRDFPF